MVKKKNCNMIPEKRSDHKTAEMVGSENVVNDETQKKAKALHLLICIKPEDDFPHPRYLCFKYPFGKTSPNRHCKKCYCYVCDELAPCKEWSKPSVRHCHATRNDEKWTLDRQLRRKEPADTHFMAQHKLTVSVLYDEPKEQVRACVGGLIYNGYGDWVTGFTMCIKDSMNTETHQYFRPAYNALLEGLEIAWSAGYRNLEVQLGFVFHDVFWDNFSLDHVSRKFRLHFDQCVLLDPDSGAVLITLLDYLNRDWYIDVKNTATFKEEVHAFAMAVMTDYQKLEEKKVFDFCMYPGLIQEVMKTTRFVESQTPENLARNASNVPPGISLEEVKK